ncbi:hypothetical protein [Streptomyces brasiliensis]|uniref:hypothetical protein n=1 Tax=Streptomyces brasiliensis TaxID=1954 RepID=UPI00166F7345|nr:hypothetical protein [Streptomyces brasiliensis]
MTWVCSAVALQGAVPDRLPHGRLVAAQFAASAADHVLPTGVVNGRFPSTAGCPRAGVRRPWR